MLSAWEGVVCIPVEKLNRPDYFEWNTEFVFATSVLLGEVHIYGWLPHLRFQFLPIRYLMGR